MKKLLILLFSIASFAALAQQGSLSQSVYRSRVNDSTAVVPSDASGYGSLYWNNQATNPGWRVWVDGLGYVIWDPSASGGGGGGHTIEEEGTPLTQRSNMNFTGAGVAATDAGGKTVITVGGALGVANQVLSGNRTITGAFSLGLSGLTTFSASTSGNIGFVSSGGDISFGAPTFGVTTSGAWSINADEGSDGQVLTTHGTGTPPTWETPSSGGTPGGSDTQVQFNNSSAFGGDADFTFTGGNTLNVDFAIVDTEAYDASGWNADNSVPTKDAVRDKIEAMGSVVGAQDLFITAAAMWPRATSGCAPLIRTEMATSIVNIQTLDFDESADEFAQFQFSMPRNWNNGTVTATVYWTASTGTGTVQWQVSGGAYSNDDPLTTALGSVVEIDDTLIATNDVHVSPTSSAITIAGTPADGDLIYIQVQRDVSADTLTGDAKLIGVRLTFTLDAAVSE